MVYGVRATPARYAAVAPCTPFAQEDDWTETAATGQRGPTYYRVGRSVSDPDRAARVLAASVPAGSCASAGSGSPRTGPAAGGGSPCGPPPALRRQLHAA